jgi:ABC-type Fe3+ transport system substrate-binding protein
MLYNTELVKSPAELPKARIELADPKYKEKFSISVFADEWVSGILVYEDKQKWLETLDQVGKNVVNVQSNYDLVTQRMLLGEFAFAPSNSYYYFQYRAADPKTPIGIQFFSDYTLNQMVFQSVRKGARSPATATLFSLWMTTPESQAIWQPASAYTNLAFGTADLDKQEAELVKASGTKLVNWFDSPKTMEALEWLSSPEGRQFSEAVGKAISQRKA